MAEAGPHRSGVAIDGDEVHGRGQLDRRPGAAQVVWLTHDDADHTAASSGSWRRAERDAGHRRGRRAAHVDRWPVPMERVHAIRPGDDIHVGDAPDDGLSAAVRQPDVHGRARPAPAARCSPSTPSGRSSRSPRGRRGRRRPRPSPPAGLIGWATSDSPWLHISDPAEFGQVLDRVRRIQPRHIFFLAPARRQRDVAGGVPARPGTGPRAAERFVPPDAEQFAEMIKAMAEQQRAGEQVPETGRPDAVPPSAAWTPNRGRSRRRRA